MTSKVKLILILFLVFFLTGCRSTLVVRNATVNQLSPILKDYAGIHGYTISYQNDQTGSYRLDLGSVYVPNRSEMVRTKEANRVITSENINQSSLTSYEQTSWQTVSVPGHYLQASVMVRLIQQGNDVLMIMDSNDAVGSSLTDLHDYIEVLGHSVDYK